MSVSHLDPGGYGPPPAHDRLVCGLDEFGPTLCPGCLAELPRRLEAKHTELRRETHRRRRRETEADARRLAELLRLHPRRLRKLLVDILADELPEAVEYLVNRHLAARNGQDARRTYG